MKTHKQLLLIIIFVFTANIVKGQDVNKAMQYFNAQQYEQAALEYENAIPLILQKYGQKDTNIYSKLLFYTAISFERYQNFKKAEQYYLQCKKVYENINAVEIEFYTVSCNKLEALHTKNSENKLTEKGNIKKATKYFNKKKYKQAALEFEIILSDIEQILGKQDTIYGKMLFYTAESFNKCFNQKKAEYYYLACNTFYQSIGATLDPFYTTSCNNLANLFVSMGNYTKAEPLYIKLQKIYEEVYGKEHTLYATSCNNLADLYADLGNYKKAEPLFIEAIYIEKILGTSNPNYATSCNNLANLYLSIDNYSKAELLYIKSQKIYEKVYGKEHTLYALSCNNLASLYADLGNYKKAEQLYIEAKKITEEKLGISHPDYAGSCNNLADLYVSMGNYSKAEPLYIKSQKIYEEVYGKEHTFYAISCNNLAGLYADLGNYAKAEQLYIEAKEIDATIFGLHHPNYATICNNLALLYNSMGNYQKAEQLYIKSQNIYEEVYGKEHTLYAISCNNLAGLYKSMCSSAKTFKKRSDAYQKAEVLYIQAKKIDATIFGLHHPNYASSCNNLAVLYDDMGNYKKAEPLIIEAKNIREKVLGKEHLSYAASCNNLAALYYAIGNYQKAEPLIIEAKNIREKGLGNQHPDYAGSCNNLAGLYMAMGNYQKAEPLYIEANSLMHFLSKQSAKFMSEKEREKYLKAEINYYFKIYHSFFLTRRKENKKLAGIVYNNALNIKGQLLKSSIVMRKAVLQSGDTTLINTYEKMNELGQILAKQYSLPIAKRRPDINELKEKVNLLEKELVSKSQNLQSLQDLVGLKDISWQTIQKSLKPNETAIEFIHFNYHNGKEWTDSTLYYALVLRKDYKYPKAVYLFEEKQLQKIFDKTNTNNDVNTVAKLYRGGINKLGFKNQISKSHIDSLIWQPFNKYLKGVKTVYISPSGLLNKIAFDAVPYKDSLLLSDKYNIVYTTSTAQITNKKTYQASNISNSVLFGGLYYDITIDDMKKNAEAYKSSGRSYNLVEEETRSSISWSYLQGTLKEVSNIEKILTKNKVTTQLYKGNKGNEEVFKSLEKYKPEILHIATHGFYFSEPEIKRENKNVINDNTKQLQFTDSENPLLRSGLLLSGAQNAFSGKTLPKGLEDGVLTASEISQMNLFNTKLAILSACQTGLGDVKGSEGVYGLQRAFKMAGVDYLIYSLWEVPDFETQEFMNLFYNNWFTENDIKKAFDKTQKYMKTKYHGEPYKWAAFVLIK